MPELFGTATASVHAALARVAVVLDAAVPRVAGATLHLCLEEVGRADAPATLLAEVEVPGMQAAGPGVGEALLSVPLRAVGAAPPIAADRDYAVRGWLVLEGVTIAQSDQRCPVLTHGHGPDVTLTLR